MAKKQSGFEQFAVRMTQWIGTPASIISHTILFTLTFMAMFFFDPQTVMLVLTTIVSLEAIYLSLFIQMSVNRQHSRIKGIEEDIDDILKDTEELTE